MSHEELLHFIQIHCGICGCADEDGAVGFLMDLLDAGEIRGEGMHEEADAILADVLPEEPCLERHLPLYWIDSIGLTEHGPSGISDYQLTELGHEILEALREYGTGDELWELDVAMPDQPDRSLN